MRRSACGNFGAPPNPPLRESKLRRSAATPRRRPRLSMTAGVDGCSERRRQARQIRLAAPRDLVALVAHASAIACSTMRKLGLPSAVVGRVVGAGVERRELRGQEQRQRPAAAWRVSTCSAFM